MCYLVLLVAAVVTAAARGIDLTKLPLVIFIVMIMCPFLFITIFGDVKNCGKRTARR